MNWLQHHIQLIPILEGVNELIDAVCLFLCEKFESFFLIHNMLDALVILDGFLFNGLHVMCRTLQTISRF
jgi:hypothetical protein